MMDRSHYQLFETAAGVAAIGWNRSGVTALRLPAPSAAEAERAITSRLQGAVRAAAPPEVRAVIDKVVRYFAGECVDFADVPIDMGEQDPFFARVYELVRRLGRGETTTYGAIARALDTGPEYARAVGQAMAKNPIPLIVPCHRVTAAGGKIGGFSAPGGSVSKARMLEIEGVATDVSAQVPAQQGFDF